MKQPLILLILLFTSLFLQCATSNRITYNIPDNYPDARRKQILEICAKGKELYKAHCTECHGVFTKGKDKIPDFTNTQLDNYSSRFIRRDPKNHAAAIQMSEDQLNYVITFLRFKNPQNKDTIIARKNRGL